MAYNGGSRRKGWITSEGVVEEDPRPAGRDHNRLEPTAANWRHPKQLAANRLLLLPWPGEAWSAAAVAHSGGERSGGLWWWWLSRERGRGGRKKN